MLNHLLIKRNSKIHLETRILPSLKAFNKLNLLKNKYNMGRIIIEYLEGEKIYVCKKCYVHLSTNDYLFSKVFKYFYFSNLQGH